MGHELLVGELSGDALAAIAAFLSGMGSVLTGWLALRYEAKRSDRNCQARIDAFLAGIGMREEMLQSDSAIIKDEGDK